MTLLRQIQDAAIDSSNELSDLLRRCKVLAARLKHAEFGRWVNNELNGYGQEEPLPEYRQTTVLSVGNFAGPFGSGIRNAVIPASQFPEDIRSLMTDLEFRQPVSALQELLASSDGSLKARWPAELVAMAQRHPVYDDMVLADAWRPIPNAVIRGMLDTVRTRVLDFVLAIENEAPDAGEAEPGAPPAVEPDRVTNIFNTTINGGQANVATGGKARIVTEALTISTAVTGQNRAELEALVRELRSQVAAVDDEDEREEATEVLSRVEAQLASRTPDVKRIQSYLAIFTGIVTTAATTANKVQEILKALGF